MIAGGFNSAINGMSNEIYYCVSNDINNKNSNENNQSIWQLSLIKLPFAINKCKAMIKDQKSKNPKLIILGGQTYSENHSDTYLEYNLNEIMGYERFIRFIIDMTQVYLTLFFNFVLFYFVLIGLFAQTTYN